MPEARQALTQLHKAGVPAMAIAFELIEHRARAEDYWPTARAILSGGYVTVTTAPTDAGAPSRTRRTRTLDPVATAAALTRAREILHKPPLFGIDETKALFPDIAMDELPAEGRQLYQQNVRTTALLVEVLRRTGVPVTPHAIEVLWQNASLVANVCTDDLLATWAAVIAVLPWKARLGKRGLFRGGYRDPVDSSPLAADAC